MVCKELSNSVYKQYLTSVKLLKTVNAEINLPCKIHSISCHQLIRIKQLFRLHLEKIKFYRTNYRTYEAQNFSEQASHDYEYLINFSEFI